MIATVVNAAAVILGSLVGLLLHGKVKESFKTVVHVGAGITTIVIAVQMALSSSRIVLLALSLIIGGILGEWWGIEAAILRLGETLKRTFARKDSGGDFAYGFLNASVLFCVGAMALIGSFKAGAEGDYSLILTKSVMDAFMAVVFAAAFGVGVAFSALPVLVYQGALTLAAVWLKPLVTRAPAEGAHRRGRRAPSDDRPEPPGHREAQDRQLPPRAPAHRRLRRAAGAFPVYPHLTRPGRKGCTSARCFGRIRAV